MTTLASLPLQIVASCIESVDLSDRLNVMVVCRRFHDAALTYAWPPWERLGLGLVHACLHSHVAYYERWSAVAGSRWHPARTEIQLSNGYDNSEHVLYEGVCGKGSLAMYLAFVQSLEKRSNNDAEDEEDNDECVEASVLGSWERISRGWDEVGMPPLEYALFRACEENNIEVARYLLCDLGVDPRAYNSHPYCGEDPAEDDPHHIFVWGACYGGNMDVLRLLCADERISSHTKSLGLANAAHRNCRCVVEFLLEHEPNRLDFFADPLEPFLVSYVPEGK